MKDLSCRLGYMARALLPLLVGGHFGLACSPPEESKFIDSNSSATTTTIGLTADSHVRSGTTASTNYGSASKIQVDGMDGGSVIQAFVRFSIGDVSSISSAKLRLYVRNGSKGPISVRQVSSTSWGETSITWNNKPAIDGPLVATIGATTSGTWVDVDVTSVAQSNTSVSLAFVSGTSNGFDFSSTNASANTPQLVVVDGGGTGGSGGTAGSGGTGGSGGTAGSGGTGGSGGGDQTTSGFYGPGLNADAIGNHQVADVDVGIRFRASTTSAAANLIWYNIHTTGCYSPPSAGYSCGTGGIIRICIETDDGTSSHLPSGNVLGCAENRSPLASYFPVEWFSPPPTLTKGQLYHIRFHNIHSDPLNNFVSVNGLYISDAVSPRQPTIPDTDLAMFRGRSLYDRATPIFQLGYADGTVQGQGYMEVWVYGPADVSGGSKVRETFTVSGQSRVVKSVRVRLNRAGGSNPLAVRLETGSGTLIEEGTIPASAFALASEVWGSGSTWGTYTFRTPQTLAGGQSYNLVFSAPADTRYRAVPIRRGPSYGFTAPGTFFGDGFGQFSTNGGATWSGFNQPGGFQDTRIADVQFYFTF